MLNIIRYNDIFFILIEIFYLVKSPQKQTSKHRLVEKLMQFRIHIELSEIIVLDLTQDSQSDDAIKFLKKTPTLDYDNESEDIDECEVNHCNLHNHVKESCDVCHHKKFPTGKSLSEALLFADHGESMLCTKIVPNVRNNFCTQHVLSRFDLEIVMY